MCTGILVSAALAATVQVAMAVLAVLVALADS